MKTSNYSSQSNVSLTRAVNSRDGAADASNISSKVLLTQLLGRKNCISRRIVLWNSRVQFSAPRQVIMTEKFVFSLRLSKVLLWRCFKLGYLCLLQHSIIFSVCCSPLIGPVTVLLTKKIWNSQYTRWFKYDRDWFVCKQGTLRSSCATLREWSHNLHPPSCSG